VSGALLKLVYVLVFLSTILLAEFVFGQVGAATAAKHVNRRLGLIAAGKSRDEVLLLLRREGGSVSSRLPIAPLLEWLEHRLMQSGMQIGAPRMLAAMTLGTLVVAIVFPLLAKLSDRLHSAGALILLVVFAVGIGVGLPLAIINIRAARRIKLFDAQFPVALDIFVRGLRAGHPVSAALDLLTTEIADPCGSEFGIVIDEINYGLDLREALDNLSERIGSQDVRMFVVCVAIQNETGGNLAEILDGLTKVIRDRRSMVMKVRALASEGKMTGTMLSILPVFTFGIVFVTSPGFYLDVADDPVFVPASCCILALYVVGVLTIRKMVALKI